MWKRLFAVGLLVPAWVFVAGCAEDRVAADRNLPPPAPASIPASAPASGPASTQAPEPRSSSGAGRAPVGAPDPDKDKPRGNTPPGMDRSGGGPMDGAIRDPAGVVTKQPDPK